MGTPKIDFKEIYKLLKQDFSVGIFNIHIDLTNGLSEKEYCRKQQRDESGMYIQSNGRIIIPRLGIY